MRFLPRSGKVLVRFSKQLIEQFERERPRDLSWGRIIVKEQKAFDYTIKASVEVATIEMVNASQTFFKPGDKVLLSYLVFYDGRGENARGNPTRKFTKMANGDELFIAYDGSTKWDNITEIYAKITPNGLEMCPGIIMINEPRRTEKYGHIIIPEEFQKEKRETGFAATIENINPVDAEELGAGIGQEIICSGGTTYEVQVGDTEKKQSFYFLRKHYVLALLNKQTA